MLDLPLPPVHGRSLSTPLFLPGGPATSPGHGVLLLAAFGGLGLGVEVAGLGVGAGVTRGVGFGVGFAVGFAVGFGDGAAVARGVGAGVAAGVGAGVTTGAGVGSGEFLVAPAGVGSPLNGEDEGLGSMDAEGLASGPALGDGSTDGCPAGGDTGGCVPDGSLGAPVSTDAGVGVEITAMSAGRRDA